MAKFSELGVDPAFIKAIKEIGIENPSAIQEEVIPFLLSSNRDLVGLAQTGTGKTAAFGLPLLQKTNPKLKEIQTLVLAPTRELCQQIVKQLFKFTKYSDKIFVEGIYGGAKIDEQIRRLQRPTHVIVATPGRLMDLLERKTISLDYINTVVLDEADEMLNMGFRKDIEKILSNAPKQRSTWLFSATMPKGVQQIVDSHFASNAKTIQPTKVNSINENISHQYLLSNDNEKFQHLNVFVRSQGDDRGVVFCRLKSEAKKVAQQLASRNIKADVIQGDMQQKERDKVMRAFKNGSLQVLVATDLAARGIDIKDLSFVIHYQLPEKIEFYTHRSGRTGRAGQKGMAVSIITEKEFPKLKAIAEKLNFKLKIAK